MENNMISIDEVVGPVREAWQVSICSFCDKKEHWTEQSLNPLIHGPGYVRQYPPKGWHSAGRCPGFCSKQCNDNYYNMKAAGRRAEADFKKKALEDARNVD